MFEKLSPLFREEMLKLTEAAVNNQIIPKKASQVQVQALPEGEEWGPAVVKRAILEKLASAEPQEFGTRTAEALRELRAAIDSFEKGAESPVKVIAKGF